MADDLYYVGIQPTVLDFEGSQVVVGPGTVVHRDSAIRKAFPSLFGPLVVHFDAAPTKAEAKATEKAEKADERKAAPEPEKRAAPEAKVEPEKRLHTR